MTVSEVTNELKKMNNADRLLVIEIATKLLRDELNEKGDVNPMEMRNKLQRSADIMKDEYSNDKELTAVTDALGHEDFLDA